jgi:hypothetical protein
MQRQKSTPPMGMSAPSQGTLREHVGQLLHSMAYRSMLLITALFSFGFYITHYTVNVDDLTGTYYVSGELLAQGRFTWSLIGRFLKLYEHFPFFDAALAIALMLVMLTLLCALFRLASGGTVTIGACIVFSCLYISYPLACEAYAFDSLPLYIHIGGLMSFGALYLIYRADGRWKPLSMALACALLILVCSLYESVATMYMFFVCALLLITMRSGTARFRGIGGFLLEGLRCAAPLMLAFVLETLIANWLINSLHLTRSVNALNSIIWAKGFIRACLNNIVTGFFYNVCIKSLVYLPLGVICVAMAGMLIFAVVDSIRHKPHLPMLMAYGGLFITLIVLSLVQGVSTTYRTAQTYPLFVGFLGLLLAVELGKLKSKQLRTILVCGVALLVYFQASDLNHWFVLDHQRYLKERADVVAMADDIRIVDETGALPVVFVGTYHMDKRTYEHIIVTDADMVEKVNGLRALFGWEPVKQIQIVETAVRSYISWGTVAFGSNRWLIAFFDYCGYRLKEGTDDMITEAKQIGTSMPAWPMTGSIRATDDYVIVNFGN